MSSEWFDSAFCDWMDEKSIDPDSVGEEVTKLMKAAYYAGAFQAIEFSKVCIEQEIS